MLEWSPLNDFGFSCYFILTFLWLCKIFFLYFDLDGTFY